MLDTVHRIHGSSAAKPFTVSQLNGIIQRLIDEDERLSELWLEGEVSNFGRAASGHCYFTLKDASAQISCVMWRNVAAAVDSLPADGDLIVAHGRVGVYEAAGRYQLYVDYIEPAGVGNLYRQLELLKKTLQAEGLFDTDRKRQLPPFPQRIGVVTSPSAAAFQDILNVLARRFPIASVLLSPALVQGEEAPIQIVEALERLNARDDVDVIIIARGGGSLEDLWAFNDERLARAVAESRIPVVCGVGHETDFSLADFAADVRAPTPSAAAELVAPDRSELAIRVRNLVSMVTSRLESALGERRRALSEHCQRLDRVSPSFSLAQARQQTDDLLGRLRTSVDFRVTILQERLTGVSARLDSISPLNTLERGYAVVRDLESGEIVIATSQVQVGDNLTIRVTDGTFGAKATG
jgi:exodeoxyribonuclease VII large subunit